MKAVSGLVYVIFYSFNKWLAALFLFFGVAFFAMACTHSSGSADTGSESAFTVIDPAAYAKQMVNGTDFYLIDIRTPDEYNNMHLDGAILINYYDSDFRANLEKLDKDKPVFLYCATGGRTSSASRIMQSMGFKTVTDLSGGIQAWRRSNFPVVSNRRN